MQTTRVFDEKQQYFIIRFGRYTLRFPLPTLTSYSRQNDQKFYEKNFKNNFTNNKFPLHDTRTAILRLRARNAQHDE